MNSLSDYQPKDKGFFNLAAIKPETDWSEFFSSRSVYLGMEIPEQKPVIVDQEGIPIGSLGELMLITGKPKAGKSRLLSVFLSTALSNDLICNLKGYSYGDKNKVVVMDTEQNSYYNYEAFKRIRNMANLLDNDERLRYYSLSRDMPEIRLNAIEKYLEMNRDTLVLLVDGVADLCLDINSTNEATTIATTLNSLSDKYQVLIIVVLHENKGDGNAKGHLGSYLTQKTCVHISVEKPDIDSDTRNVIFRMSRGKLPKSFAFTINENGIPELDNSIESKDSFTSTKSAAFTPYSLDVIVHKNMIDEIFKVQSEYSSQDLKLAIGVKLNDLRKPAGESICKKMLSRWNLEQWVQSSGSTSKVRYRKSDPF